MVGDCAVSVVHEALGKNNRWCRRQSRLRVQCAARQDWCPWWSASPRRSCAGSCARSPPPCPCGSSGSMDRRGCSTSPYVSRSRSQSVRPAWSPAPASRNAGRRLAPPSGWSHPAPSSAPCRRSGSASSASAVGQHRRALLISAAQGLYLIRPRDPPSGQHPSLDPPLHYTERPCQLVGRRGSGALHHYRRRQSEQPSLHRRISENGGMTYVNIIADSLRDE